MSHRLTRRLIAVTIAALMGVTTVLGSATTATAADTDGWGYSTTPKNADGSLDLSGWTRIGTVARGTVLASMDFTRAGVDYTIEVHAPDATDAVYPLLVANVIRDRTHNQTWTYVSDHPFGDFSHVNANGGWSEDNPVYYKKTGPGGVLAVAVVEYYSGPTPRVMSTEVLDVTADGALIHHVILTNVSGATIPQAVFGVTVSTDPATGVTCPGKPGDCLVFSNNGHDSMYADYGQFRLYLDLISGSGMSVGKYGDPFATFVDANAAAPDATLLTDVDAIVHYSTTTADLPAATSRELAFREWLLSPAEYAATPVAVAVIDYWHTRQSGEGNAFVIAVTNSATGVPYWGVGGRIDFFLDGAATPFYSVPATSASFIAEPASLAIPVGDHAFTVRYVADVRRYTSPLSSPYPLTITAPVTTPFTIDQGTTLAKTYGDAAFTLTTSGGGSGAVTWSSADPAAVGVDSSGLVTIRHASPAGVRITAAKAADATNPASSASLLVQAAPRAVTVTADDKTKVTGAADPVLTYKVAPALLAGDALTGSLTYSGSAAGSYRIVEKVPFANPDYAVTFVAGVMVITPAPVVPPAPVVTTGGWAVDSTPGGAAPLAVLLGALGVAAAAVALRRNRATVRG